MLHHGNDGGFVSLLFASSSDCSCGIVVLNSAGIDVSFKLENPTSAILGQMYLLNMLGMFRGLDLSIKTEPIFCNA